MLYKTQPAGIIGVSQTRVLFIIGVTFQEDCQFIAHVRSKLTEANNCLLILRSLRKEGYTQAEQDAVGAYIWASMYWACVKFLGMCEVEGVELYWT